jgi:spermine oxidase
VPNEIEHFDAIILGAGIAGLGAGEVFRRANLNFLILEGQSRVGGRINTVNLGNQVNVDAGAQWLHGSDNELFKFAKKFELVRPELSEEAEGDYIREDGTRFDDFLVKKIDFQIGQILEECEDFVNHRNEENFQFPSSMEEFLHEKFKVFIESLENNEDRKKAMQLLDWHRRFQIIDNSCLNLNEISAKDWGNYSFNGESCQTHINIKNGMENLVKRLNESLKSNILLNKIVDLIYWKTEKSCKILIKCSDNSIFSTNNLICTFSVGVLKENHQNMFIPPLPIQHTEVIDSIGFGTIDKIFLVFDEKWWNDDWKGLQLLWNEDINDVRNLQFLNFCLVKSKELFF